MLTVLTLLLVLTSGQRFMPPSQAFPNTAPEQRSAQSLDKSSSTAKPSTAKHRWLKATAVSGVAASMVGAANEGTAIAYSTSSEAVLPKSAQTGGYKLAQVAQSLDKSAAALPDLARTSDATFSSNPLQTQPPRTRPSVSRNLANTAQPTTAQATTAQATTAQATTAQTSLIKQAQDGSWMLSTGASAQSDNAARSQAVLSGLVEQTKRTRINCTDRRCRGLAYIESRLPEARAEVQSIQAQLDDFETHRAQQDMEGYQKTLTERISEIARQKQDLSVATEQSQQRITQLKMRLVQMDADLELAERALDSDSAYQTDWNRLLSAEQHLMNEFSRVSIDATDLNEIYGDYQHYQQQAQLSAGEALGNYLLQVVSVPGFIKRSPDALTYLQDLTTATHAYRTQKLRQTTIGKIEKRLNDRKGQLLGDLGEYKTLQRELASAKDIVAVYEKEKEYILAKQATQQDGRQNTQQNAQRTVARSATAVDRAKRLAPLLPKGSVAQSVIYTVLAASAIAAIAAHRRSRKIGIPHLAFQSSAERDYSFQPTALQQANLMAAIKLPSLRFSAAQLQTEGASLPIPILPSSAYSEEKLMLAAPTARLYGEEQLALEEILADATPAPPEEDFEQRILTELMEITGQAPQMLNAAPDETGITETENSLTVEMMVRDLDEAIGSTTPEGSLAQEIQNREIAPVRLSLDDVDLFAEHAVRWILKDLGLSPMATALDRAEAEAKGWSEANVAEREAINSDPLEIA